MSEYIAAARSPPLSEPANIKFLRLRGILRRRNNAQWQITRSRSLPIEAVLVAGPVPEDCRSGELRIITETRGTEEDGLAADIDGSSPAAVECCAAPALSW
jgi:hypothetical protein